MLDTNGNGRRDEWAEPNQPADPQKDLRVTANTYAAMPNPKDGSVWYTIKGIGPNSAESSYYTWVDQHNTFGLGEDVPMSTGNLNDGLVTMKAARYAKGFDPIAR